MPPEPAADPWIDTTPGHILAVLPAVGGLLAAGIASGQTAAGAVAAAAAVTVGFGAFKRVHGSAGVAMALAALGMGVSAFVGTLAGQSWEAMLAAVAVWGFVAGLLPVLKSDLSWVAQQSTIVLLVASAFAGSWARGAERAALVFGGGAVQFACVTALGRLFGSRPQVWSPEWVGASRTAGAALAAEVRARSAAAGRAIRLVVVLAMAVEIWRVLELRNGYWVGMTVLLLTRPEFRDTFLRAGERVVGTVVGAGLAALLLHALPQDPSPWGVGGLAAAFALLTLALQQGNRFGDRALTYPGSYAVFSGCLTAYVVFLLDYGGLSARGVAGERVLMTLMGGVLALAVHVPLVRLRRPTARPPTNAG